MRACNVAAVSAATFLSAARATFAQDAVTITGHVTADSFAVRGANVSIPELRLSATTDADGRYSLIVPSARVRGQAVTLSARYLRYAPQSVQITLVGGTLVRDFEMRQTPRTSAERASLPSPATDSVAAPGSAKQVFASLLTPSRWTIDSAVFQELAGPVDLGGALAGRIPGLDVVGSTTPAGTSVLTYRGPHSIAGARGPLFVVDGQPLDDISFNSRSQQLGLGGFDYGNGLHDLNLADVAAVALLDPVTATMLYGTRAANGVIVVSTKNGAGLHGFDVAGTQQFTADSPLRLSTYQNAYGQGLNGAFEFFNGTGGGTNDAVAESWGPRLLSQPIAQASLTEPRRPDVRLWVPQPNNVSDYFAAGRTLTSDVSVQGANETGHFRLAAANQSVTGLTPSSSLSRQSVALSVGNAFSSRFNVAGTGQFMNDGGNTLPFTGFDPGNPVAEFAVLPRQVDVSALRNHVRDTLGNQINWIYTNQDNPYFQSVANANDTHRSRVLASGSATYALTPGTDLTARLGTDSYHERQGLTVAPGWLGGMPYFAGIGGFSTGGFENQGISDHETDAQLVLHTTARPSASRSISFDFGLSHRSSGFSLTSEGADRVATADTTKKLPSPEHVVSSVSSDAAFAGAQAGLGSYVVLNAAVRDERVSAAGGSASALYPAAAVRFDVGRAVPALTRLGLSSTNVRASWSRAGNELTPAMLRSVYFGLDTTGFPVATPAALTRGIIEPERTDTRELGLSLQPWSGRVGIDLGYYTAHSSGLLVPGRPDSLSTAAELTNTGIEAQINAVPIQTRAGFEWSLTASYARNRSRVQSLGGRDSATLGPAMWGLTLEARPGASFPALVGNTFLRDSVTGQLLLQNGHPLPDLSRRRILGSAEPDWTGSIANTIRFRAVDLRVLVDGRFGGKLFSATNLWGQYSGTLQETAFRPDSGLLISGIDVATGKPNQQHVSTQDYYHSLLPIQEQWVYDASFVKLRDVRLTAQVPVQWLPGFRAQSIRASLIGRNLYLAARAPNIDPETALSASAFQGAELGQLPTVRSIGLQFSVVP